MTTPSERRRVMVTGMGVMTPCGLQVGPFWDNLLQGRSGISRITQVDTEGIPCKIGGQVSDFNPENYMEKKEARRMDRFTQLAMAAAREAYTDSGLKAGDVDPERFGVIVGTGSGGMITMEQQLRIALDKGYMRCSPFLIPTVICNTSSGRISIEYNAQGPNLAVVSACATGSHALGDSYRSIQQGETDVMIAGGSEAPITPMSLVGFSAARALSLRNDEPERASRPFDRARDGFVMSEGATILILEELTHALNRGAKIYGEIVGYGRSADAYDVVAPPPRGGGAARAMRAAMRDADVPTDAMDYVNLHGTSTPQGDVAETQAIMDIFGPHATEHRLVTSSTKSMTGHLIGAAGAMEAAITLLALQTRMIPPTINLDDPDPECTLDYTPHHAKPLATAEVGMSNSFGFGGQNASLVFRRWAGAENN